MDNQPQDVLTFLTEKGIIRSMAEGRRLIAGQAVRRNGQALTVDDTIGPGDVIKVGKSCVLEFEDAEE